MRRVCAPAKNKKRGVWRNPEKLRRNETPSPGNGTPPHPSLSPERGEGKKNEFSPQKGERAKTTNVSLKRERPSIKALSLREKVG
jgi:hypothetical protein